jgi:hypothetical protein
MNIEYQCKLCGRKGAVEVDDGVELFTIAEWKPILCCNRCADFLESKRNLEDKIKKVAIVLNLVRRGFGGKYSESAIREKFDFHARKFAALVCHHFHKSMVWDDEFVNLLMDKPENSHRICAHYLRGIRAL